MIHFGGIGQTDLHILQTDPDRMLNAKIITLFKAELLAGRLDKNALVFELRGFKYNKDHGTGIIWTEEITRTLTGH